MDNESELPDYTESTYYWLTAINAVEGSDNHSLPLNSPSFRSDLEDHYVSILFIFTLIIALGTAINIYEIYIMIKNKLYREATNAYFLNLAVADLVKCLITIPFTIMSLLFQNWLLGEFLCYFLPMLQDVPVHVTILTLMMLLFDRFLFVRNPAKPRLPSFIFSTGAWLTAICVALPYPIYTTYVDFQTYNNVSANGAGVCFFGIEKSLKEYSHGIFICGFLLPLAVILFLFIQTFQILDEQDQPIVVDGNEIRLRANFRRYYRLHRFTRVKPEHISEVVDLGAVTYSDELDGFYRDLHAKKMGIPPQEPIYKGLNTHIKRKLCKRIFNSLFYDHQKEDWLNLDSSANRSLIGNYFPNSFNHIFKTRERPRFQCWGELTPYDNYVYENNYRIQPMYYDDGLTMTEYIFSCFTRDRETGEIKEYYVSQEYNITEAMINSYPMAGRFILAYNENNELALKAMAEEAAIGSKFVDKTNIAELYYVKFRAKTQPSETYEQDPLCSLSRGHKQRICASIFASRIFTKKFKLLQNMPFVEPFCVRKLISLFANISKRRRLLLRMTQGHLEKDKEYDEWLITCNVLDVTENKPKVYYVSRGDLQHTVFLYSRPFPDERVFVDSYMKNVAVADVENVGNDNEVAARREDGGMSEFSGTETEDDDPEHQSLFEPIFRHDVNN